MPHLVMFQFENVALTLTKSMTTSNMHQSEEQSEGINMEVDFGATQTFGPTKLESISSTTQVFGPTKLEGTSSVASNFGDMVPSSVTTLPNVTRRAIFFGDFNATIVLDVTIIIRPIKSFLL